MAVLGTPSVSLGEVGKTEVRIWSQTLLSHGDTISPKPLRKSEREVLSGANSWVVRVWLLDIFKVNYFLFFQWKVSGASR